MSSAIGLDAIEVADLLRQLFGLRDWSPRMRRGAPIKGDLEVDPPLMARMKQLRTLRVPDLAPVGRGKLHRYGPVDVLEIATCLAICDAGPAVRVAGELVAQHRRDHAEAVSRAMNGQSVVLIVMGQALETLRDKSQVGGDWTFEIVSRSELANGVAVLRHEETLRFATVAVDLSGLVHEVTRLFAAKAGMSVAEVLKSVEPPTH
ncbi:hypothetical protein F7D01_10805 [Erythrobacter sp. 3-20A1M]|uniref:hypothetical protein n=1 Tax=Erythrobacter sp. 3-20A1M TaxID=2653850 RepID=UPI001BFC95B6|nr:hypothetical protein [Erythrobacter sp. 3-20A1M]QWC57498.1 hypothetical protein F7D01_10805 [Erythrobacter sp. 3-20A1M]